MILPFTHFSKNGSFSTHFPVFGSFSFLWTQFTSLSMSWQVTHNFCSMARFLAWTLPVFFALSQGRLMRSRHCWFLGLAACRLPGPWQLSQPTFFKSGVSFSLTKPVL